MSCRCKRNGWSRRSNCPRSVRTSRRLSSCYDRKRRSRCCVTSHQRYGNWSYRSYCDRLNCRRCDSWNRRCRKNGLLNCRNNCCGRWLYHCCDRWSCHHSIRCCDRRCCHCGLRRWKRRCGLKSFRVRLCRQPCGCYRMLRNLPCGSRGSSKSLRERCLWRCWRELCRCRPPWLRCYGKYPRHRPELLLLPCRHATMCRWSDWKGIHHIGRLSSWGRDNGHNSLHSGDGGTRDGCNSYSSRSGCGTSDGGRNTRDHNTTNRSTTDRNTTKCSPSHNDRDSNTHRGNTTNSMTARSCNTRDRSSR